MKPGIEALKFWGILSLVFLILMGASCASRKLEKSLDPESQEFLSKVRYTITPEERRIFLKLSPSERPGFIEEFWKRRDPNPATPENEFKEEYFRRIEEANRLFNEGGTSGWLSDRGRIWITLGPPDHREIYPRGQSFYGFPVEIWHYGFFRIYFIDRFWNGNYQLDPASAEQIGIITQTQVDWNQPRGRLMMGSPAMDFEVRLQKTEKGQAVFSINLPYNQVWFKARGDRFETELEVLVEVEDAGKNRVWEFKKSYVLSLTADELRQNFDRSYNLEVQGEFSGQSPFVVRIVIENKVENKRSEKKLKFEF